MSEIYDSQNCKFIIYYLYSNYQDLFMKNRNLIYPFLFANAMATLIGCDFDLEPIKQPVGTPPDLTKESSFLSFTPDTGGVGTQLILRGENFGTDTSYIKVTVNNKNARVIGVHDSVIYAVVPARADTGYIDLYIGQCDSKQRYTSSKEFLYQFKRNVTTLMGQHGDKGREDGEYASSKLQRPWFLLADKDGAVFFIDEGRGTDKNGALRRAYEGLVETLVQNSNGPFQSPTALAFSPQEDTLYISNTSAGETKTDFNVIYVTRAGGFMDVRGLCKFEGSQTQGLAVHPVTGEIFFSSKLDGYVYRYVGPDYEDYEPLFQLNNNARDTELRLLFNPGGNVLYIVVRNRHCIYKVSYDAQTHTFGTPELFAGTWDESGYLNGYGAAARFNNPGQPTMDEDGNLYVPDKNSHIVRKITPEGEVSLYAGIPEQAGFGDGLPEQTKFNQPEAVAVYPLDNSIYVADRENHVIRRITVE